MPSDLLEADVVEEHYLPSDSRNSERRWLFRLARWLSGLFEYCFCRIVAELSLGLDCSLYVAHRVMSEGLLRGPLVPLLAVWVLWLAFQSEEGDPSLVKTATMIVALLP